MNDETILILAGVAVAGIALFSISSGVNTTLTSAGKAVTDISGTVPWLENDINNFASWLGGYL